MIYKIIVLLLLITSCNTPETKDNEKVLNIAVPIEMLDINPYTTIDVHSIRIRHQVFETLLGQSPSGELIPRLAVSWTNIRPTTMRISLRSNVLFHNGDTLTAEDVKASLDLAITNSSTRTAVAVIKEVSIISPLEIQLESYIPYAPLPLVLTSSSVFILSKRAIEEGDFAIGTGAFKLGAWNKGQNIILSRFDEYWGEKAKVNEVNIKTVPESLVRAIAVETGEVDISYDIDYNEKLEIDKRNDLIFDETLINRTEYLGFNPTRYPYNNQLFRNAIAYALDIPGIVNTALQGGGFQANSILMEGALGYTNAPPIKQNIQKAKELFKESGVPEGIKIRLLAIDGVRKRKAEVIQANLKEIGIDVEILVVEWAKYSLLIYAADTEMFLGGWSTAPDADLFYNILFHSNSVGSGGNFTGYADEEMDRLIDLARQELNPKARQIGYDQIYHKVNEEKVIIPLYHPINTLVRRANISNVRFDPYVLQSWKEVIKNEEK